MSKLDELLQEMVNKDYEELVGFGKIALTHLMPVFEQIDADNKGMAVLSSVILSSIGADGTLTTLERSYLRDVTGMGDDAISKFITIYTPDMTELTDKLYDAAPTELKAHLMTFVLTILAVDEKISREETAFIHRLFS